MHRRYHVRREVGLDGHAALLRHPELPAEQSLRRGRAEADEHLRLDRLELGLEPRAARGDLRPVRLCVNAPLAARLPLEVLDDVRDERERTVDAGLFEAL